MHVRTEHIDTQAPVRPSQRTTKQGAAYWPTPSEPRTATPCGTHTRTTAPALCPLPRDDESLPSSSARKLAAAPMLLDPAIVYLSTMDIDGAAPSLRRMERRVILDVPQSRPYPTVDALSASVAAAVDARMAEIGPSVDVRDDFDKLVALTVTTAAPHHPSTTDGERQSRAASAFMRTITSCSGPTAVV